ncbi:MAG: hypothetical protein ABSG36_08360 [Acidimicrobiales bacterium]
MSTWKWPAGPAKHYWSRRFGTLVAPSHPSAWPPLKTVGLEQEYRVSAGDRVVDFRTLIHRLELGRPRLDPADLGAYKLKSGAVLTADEAEAEIALPPRLVAPGFGYAIAAAALSERLDLVSRLPERTRIDGYSTHISVAVRPSSLLAIAKLYATTFGAALMLLMDSVCSPGLLVRPRASRLELGGEFVDGDRLVVAAIFAVGSVRACQRHLEPGSRRAPFPDRLRVELERDDQRYGWFVCRTAFGADLYRDGRDTLLVPRGGSPIRAQAHLERCWAVARETLVGDLDATELGLADSAVSSTEPLPALRPSGASGEGPSRPSANCVMSEPIAAAFGSAVRAHSRAGYDLAPVMLTWDSAVFVVSDPRRDRIAFAHVPAPLLASFTGQLEQGVLDETIRSYLALPSGGRRLDGAAARRSGAGLYDQLAPRARLLVPERTTRTRGGRRNHFVPTTIRHGRRRIAALGSDRGSREFV